MAEKSSIYAAVDLGSNSFHLLIARANGGKIETIDREKEQVKLAEGLLPDGTLKPEVEDKALSVLRRFADLLEGLPKHRIRVVGTNSLRVAKNSLSFYAAAEEILGVAVEVISGREEARLIYSGVASDFAPEEDNRLVLDIGGGSTELILGGEDPEKMESLFMGCVSYTNKYFPDGELSKKHYKAAFNAARLEIQSTAGQFNQQDWDHVVGASGTIRTVDKIIGTNRKSAGVILAEDVERVVDQLLAFSTIDEIKIPQLGDKRKQVFPGGLAILHAIFQELKIKELHVTKYALKEGILYEMLGRSNKKDKREETLVYMMDQFDIDKEQAKRVETQAMLLLESAKDSLSLDLQFAEAVLHWAANLHELGLSISHSGYHKHGAYILENADLPGFNRVEQRWLSFLIQNHRRKLSSPEETYGFHPYWPLVFILRLSCLIHRGRRAKPTEEVRVSIVADDHYEVSIPEVWNKKKALLIQDLKSESRYWEEQKIKISISEVKAEESAEESPQESVLTGKVVALQEVFDKKQLKKLQKKNISNTEELNGVSAKKLAKILGIKEKKVTKMLANL